MHFFFLHTYWCLNGWGFSLAFLSDREQRTEDGGHSWYVFVHVSVEHSKIGEIRLKGEKFENKE